MQAKRASELSEGESITYSMNHDKSCRAVFMHEYSTIRAIFITDQGHVFNIEGTPEYINQVQTNVEEYATIVDSPSVWPGARGFDQEDD